jgi:hypothetical protein
MTVAYAVACILVRFRRRMNHQVWQDLVVEIGQALSTGSEFLTMVENISRQR